MDNNQIMNQSSNFSTTSAAPVPTHIIYAGFFRRFFASMIDGFFTGIIGWIISFALGTDYIISMSVSALVSIIYTTIFDSSELQGTPGKAILGIAITSEQTNERISFQTALVRFLCKYISTAILLIGYLIQPFTGKRQALHDILTKTLVIKRDPGTTNYFDAFKNNFSKILNN